MADRDRIKRNVARMIEQGAPEAEIESYIAGEGLSAADLREIAQPASGASYGALAGDVAKSAGTGLARGAIGLAGMPGDVGDLMLAGSDWVMNKFGVTPPSAEDRAAADTMPDLMPGSADIQKGIEGVTGDFYEPQTTAGQYARTIGEFAPAMAAGPGGVMRRAAVQVAAPAVASETAGQMTKGSAAEPVARIAGALAGGGIAAGAANARNAMRNYVPGMSGGASRTLEKAVTPDATARMAELGPEAFLLEATPGTMGVAQGIATRPGSAQNALVNAVQDRQTGANTRLLTELDDTLGPAPLPSRIEGELKAQMEDVGKLYPGTLRTGQRVNVGPILKSLDEVIKVEKGGPLETAQKLRDILTRLEVRGDKTVRVPESDPMVIHNAREAIDELVNKLADAPKSAGLASRFRRELDDALAQSVPRVKDLDRQYSALKGEGEALVRGGQVLGYGKTATRPQDLATEMSAMTPMQQQRLREGTRAELDRLVGTKVNDVTALKLAVQSEGDWNRVKLAQVFGQDEADRIMKAVDREAAFQDAHRRLIENSMTAQRLGGAKLVESETGNRSLHDMTLTGAVAATGQRIAQGVRDAVTSGRRTASDEELARALITKGSNRDELLDAIMSAQTKRQRGRSTSRDMLVQALLNATSATVPVRQ